MYRVDARSPPSPVCIFSLVLPACCVVAVVLALTAAPPPLSARQGKARRQFKTAGYPNVGPRVAGSEQQHVLIRSRTIPPPLHQYPTDYHTSRSIVI